MCHYTVALKQLLLPLCFVLSLFMPSLALGVSTPVNLIEQGLVGDTLVFRADLTGIGGLTQIGSITINDNGSQAGDSGIFSGYDLDAIFLDKDGSLSTVGDRSFSSSFIFNAGVTRPPTSSGEVPNAAHPGPTFGSLNGNTVDQATATLNVFDANYVPDVDVASGFLTFGDGGTLAANFNPNVPIGSSLFLFVGKAGGEPGEDLGASVFASDQAAVPEPSTVLLFGTGIVGLGAWRWKRMNKA